MVAALAPSGAWAADAARGKKIFDEVCAHCHRTDDQDKIGPGLAGVVERVPPEKLDAWLKDPTRMVKEDEYFRELRNANRYGIVMPPIPAMQDPEKRADVIEYLKTLK